MPIRATCEPLVACHPGSHVRAMVRATGDEKACLNHMTWQPKRESHGLNCNSARINADSQDKGAKKYPHQGAGILDQLHFDATEFQSSRLLYRASVDYARLRFKAILRDSDNPKRARPSSPIGAGSGTDAHSPWFEARYPNPQAQGSIVIRVSALQPVV